MEDGEHDGGAFADFVVVEVAAIVAGRRGGGGEIAGRGDSDAAEHGAGGELERHPGTDRLTQADRAAGQIDIPGDDVVATLADDVGLVAVWVDGFDIVGREREKAEAIGGVAPVAIQPDLAQGHTQRVAGLGAFDVERTG